MAVISINTFRILVLFVLINSGVIIGISGKSFPSLDIVERWATTLSGQLVLSVNTTSGYGLLAKDYNDQWHESGRIVPEGISGKDLVEDMAESLASVLGQKMKALNDSVIAAEKAAANHSWNPNIKKSDVDYVNAKELMDNDTRLVYHKRFKQKISPNFTSVHIPVEIYNEDVEILNGLKWSSALDNIFKENFDNDENILWQYFGSQTGFMRTLPASRWKTPEDQVDLYDVRRRPWYIQGSSSPKDMMIIIDTSGSVHGQALQLVKVSVKSLLDTLGENDFVNIAKFDTKASFVSCFQTFVQANYRNKQILANAVDELKAQNQADYAAGFTFAFEQFEKFENTSRDGQGAHCNKMIMLLTDGGTDNAKEVFEKYNWPGKKVRVFTYAVGPTANPVSSIRWMACVNKGYFSQIPAMGAIRSKVQEYMKALVEVKANYNVSNTAWEISYDPRGLGMMTTVTLPVYNRTKGSSNQTILGVMGIDVTTEEMQKNTPEQKLGARGYAFAINSNGYIIFHPGLKIHGYLSDPPNVDFLEVEVENEQKVEMRKRMIDIQHGTTDQETIDTYMVSPEGRHVDKEKRLYTFTGITETTFSLGICIPADKKYYLKVELNLNNFDEDMLNSTSADLLIADWDFYENFSLTPNLTGKAEDLIDLLNDAAKVRELQDGNSKIGKEYGYRLKHLLWDINITNSFTNYWSLLLNSEKNKTDLMGTNGSDTSMIGAFIGTYGGLTRVFPKSLAADFKDQENPWKAEYFRRAVDSPNIIYSAPFSKDAHDEGPNSTTPHVTAVKSVFLEKASASLKYPIAVAGAVFTHDSIRKHMQDASVVNGSEHYLNCHDSDHVICYLLDDGAFLISTNQEENLKDIGRYLGSVDPLIMNELYNKTYDWLEQYDYQALCEPEDNDVNAGPSIFRIPSINLLFDVLSFKWWTSAVTWSLYNFNLYNWMFGSPVNQATAAVSSTYSCIKKQAQYFFKEGFVNINGSIDCDIKNCSRDYTAVLIRDTNLLLVVTEPRLSGVCERCQNYFDKAILIQEPVEVMNEPDFCNMEPRYRKQPKGCWDSDSNEDTTRCSGPRMHQVSILLLLSSFFIACLLTERIGSR